MAKLEIKIHPSDVLRRKAEPVTDLELKSSEFQQFCLDLLKTLEGQYPLGAGLAANQVGSTKRVFAVNVEIDQNNFIKHVFINPEITYFSVNKKTDWEGCLSIPDQWGKVKRSESITLRALNPSGKKLEFNATDFFARLLQHELDHLDGVLFIDKLETKLVDTKTFEDLLQKEADS